MVHEVVCSLKVLANAAFQDGNMFSSMKAILLAQAAVPVGKWALGRGVGLALKLASGSGGRRRRKEPPASE